MFGLLKDKLSGFIKGLAGREEKKHGSPQEEPPQPVFQEAKKDEPAQTVPKETRKQETKTHRVFQEAKQPEQQAPPVREPELQLKEGVHAAIPPQHEHKKSVLDSVFSAFAAPKKEEAKKEPPKQEQKKEEARAVLPQKPAEQKNALPSQQPLDLGLSDLQKKVYSEKRDLAPKIGLGTAIKSFFSNEITIGESEVSDLVSELELSLLEADVAYDVSMEVASQLKSQLVGMRVPKGEVELRTRQAVQNVLASVMDSDRKFDFVERVRGLAKPAKILFVGPNGAGKTTTMAKIARMLMDGGMSVVFSASDTFRAAAIEQTEVHGSRLGVRVIKSKYGADPASVAFDAVSFARSNLVDVVLMDSAGRQDTNANLLLELKKINRVAKPDIRIYVGESIGGNSVIDQIRAFDSAIGIDGAILTKIDCDAKGGTAISIAKATGIPVLFLGIGQGYADLVPFDPKRVAHDIMN